MTAARARRWGASRQGGALAGPGGPAGHAHAALREPSRALALLDAQGRLQGFNRPLLAMFGVDGHVRVNALPERAAEHLAATLRDPADLTRAFRAIAGAGGSPASVELQLINGSRVVLSSRPRGQSEPSGWLVQAAHAAPSGPREPMLRAGADLWAAPLLSPTPPTDEQLRHDPPQPPLPADSPRTYSAVSAGPPRAAAAHEGTSALDDRLLIDRMPVALIVRDGGGRVLRANAEGYQLLQPLGGELAGIDEDGAPLHGLDWPDRLAGQSGRAQRGLVGVHTQSGLRWLWIEAVPLEEAHPGPPYAVSATLTDVTAYKARQDERGQRALHDALTGLPTRGLFLDELARADARARRSGALTGALFLDVDGLKAVNDHLGHAMGDDLLRAVADRLRRTVRPHDMVARYGGDEFVVLCENLHGQDEIELIAARVREGLSSPPTERLPRLSVSVGAAAARHVTQSLIAEADQAMYREKSVRARR